MANEKAVATGGGTVVLIIILVCLKAYLRWDRHQERRERAAQEQQQYEPTAMNASPAGGESARERFDRMNPPGVDRAKSDADRYRNNSSTIASTASESRAEREARERREAQAVTRNTAPSVNPRANGPERTVADTPTPPTRTVAGVSTPPARTVAPAGGGGTPTPRTTPANTPPEHTRAREYMEAAQREGGSYSPYGNAGNNASGAQRRPAGGAGAADADGRSPERNIQLTSDQRTGPPENIEQALEDLAHPLENIRNRGINWLAGQEPTSDHRDELVQAMSTAFTHMQLHEVTRTMALLEKWVDDEGKADTVAAFLEQDQAKPRVRAAMIKQLVELGDERAGEAIVRWGASEPVASPRLIDEDAPGAQGMLLHVLDSENPTHRVQALMKLRDCGTVECLDTLRAHESKEEHRGAQMWTTKAIEAIEKRGAVAEPAPLP